MDKNVLARATEDSDSPTPGYLYGEIARMTQHSFDTCLKVQEYLIGRLKKNKPNIKYKALQVIKHICREGRQEFRREMQKHVPTVKEALQFRGPPDPLRGDEYYRRVRDAAKDCLDAIFDTNVNAVAGISTRIKGVGNPEAAPQASGWFNRGSKDNAPTQFQVPGAYNTSGPPPAGYDAPGGYPGGYNGPAYPGSDANQYPSQQQQQPPGYGGAAPSYPGGPLPPYGSNPGGGHPGGNYPPPPGMTGLGNPIFEDKKGEGSKGFFEGLKEKVSFKSEPKVTFAGAPPGSHSAPDGWSFSTNRGPTSGAFNPNAPSTYNPSEPYRPNHQPPPPYNTSQVGGYTGPTSSYAAPSSGLTYSDSSEAESRQHKSQELRDRAYEGERQKGRVGGVWDSLPTPTLSKAAPQHRPSQRQSDDGPRPAERIQNEWAQEQQYVRRPSATGPPPSTSSAQPQQTFGRSGASSDGAYERGIIQGLCAPGGMRAVPPKDKLDAFLKSALTLDAEVVGPILDELLGTDASSWQVVSKALTVIDGLLATNGCETFHEYFTDNYDMILHVSTASDKAAVRDRAVKILHVLGKATSSTAAPSRRNSGNPAPSATSGDLLGGFDSPSSTPPQPSSQAPNVPPSSSSSGGLFAGLQTSSSSSVDGHAAPAAPQYTQQPQSVQATANMFGGLSLGRLFIGKCQYKTGKCFKERTLKRNGQAHSLCEEHRVKQNLIQRRSDRKYQSLHAVRRKERSQVKALFKKQVTMAVAHQMYYEHQHHHHHKILNPLVFHNNLASVPHHHHPSAVAASLPSSSSPGTFGLGYPHGMLPPVAPSMLLCGLPKSAYDSPVVHKNVKHVSAPSSQGMSPLGANAAIINQQRHHVAALKRKEGGKQVEERSWKHAVEAPSNQHSAAHDATDNAQAATVDSWTDDDVQLLKSFLLV
ncbi:hypothetical protein DYB35_009778 [Aphanomyces astaci]|uniref:ENTH domain-containing protein n=1 Tax=Aphanomyces astaci TaxID=112090 RepID=A0A418CYD8_APHAT|nr:hypothetical protein DYB35_009778 [Aphanomyces astaci]